MPLLFIHGTTADRKSWSAVSSHLEKYSTVLTMDRRGRGFSGDAPDYSLMHESEDIAAVIESVDRPVILFGHSYGGLCSLEAALLTDRIERLILYEPAIPTGTQSIPTEIPGRIQSLVDGNDLEGAMMLFLREVAEIPPEELEIYRQSPLWTERLPLTRTLRREMEVETTYRFDRTRFEELRVPVMLIHGADSPPQYIDAVKMLEQVLPSAEVVALPGEQHLAHHTNPALLAEIVRNYLPE